MTNKLALVVAVVLGVMSILGVRFYVEKIKTTYDQKVAPVDVPVATRDLKPGDVVSKADITIQQFPHGVIDALGGSHWLASDTDKFEGSRVVQPIKQGQVYQQYHFRQQVKTNTLPQLGTDFRAMTIVVNPSTGLAGMLRPGDKVDIVVTAGYEDLGNVGGAANKKKLKITSTLAQKVDVLAIDGSTDAQSQVPDYTTITIKLHPEDANRLVFAIHNGWQYQLLKMDDTATQSGNLSTVFPDKEYDRVEPEIKAFFEKKYQKDINKPR